MFEAEFFSHVQQLGLKLINTFMDRPPKIIHRQTGKHGATGEMDRFYYVAIHRAGWDEVWF